MKNICIETSELKDENVFDSYETKYGLKFDNEFREFFSINNGGIPEKNSVTVDGEEYEIRCFMSFNSGEYNSVEIPFESFQKETNGKIYPIAKDSGDNYFCINKETGKVYFWNKDDNLYYELAENLSEFIDLM